MDEGDLEYELRRRQDAHILGAILKAIDQARPVARPDTWRWCCGPTSSSACKSAAAAGPRAYPVILCCQGSSLDAGKQVVMGEADHLRRRRD